MSVSIQTVNRNSPAHAAGMRAGDSLLSINGHVIRDVLDYKFYSYDAKITVCYTRQGGQELVVRLKKDERAGPWTFFYILSDGQSAFLLQQMYFLLCRSIAARYEENSLL